MTQELTADDITTGTELVYQAPSVDFTNDRDYTTPTRGTVVETVEETKHLGSRTMEQTMVVIETEDGEERIDIDNLVGETDFRVGVVDEEAEDNEEDDDEDDKKLVADGGDDNTEQFTDDEISDAIEAKDDPDHPDATTVSEARTHLGQLQESFVDYWDMHLDAIDDGTLEVVHEDSDVMVLADHSGHGWSEELSELDLRQSVAGDVLKVVHHKAARRLCDYSWSASDPFVVAKPDEWQTGEMHVERRVAQIASAGCSEAAAMDYWATEVKEESQSSWARFVGKDQSTVSENVKKAKEALRAQ